VSAPDESQRDWIYPKRRADILVRSKRRMGIGFKIGSGIVGRVAADKNVRAPEGQALRQPWAE